MELRSGREDGGSGKQWVILVSFHMCNSSVFQRYWISHPLELPKPVELNMYSGQYRSERRGATCVGPHSSRDSILPRSCEFTLFHHSFGMSRITNFARRYKQ